MRILQINAVYNQGSTGVIVKDIDETLQENGYESFVAYATCSKIPKNGFKIGNKIDYKVHGLLTRILGKQAYFSTLSTKSLIRYIKRVNPDIIHLHNLHNNYIDFNLLLKYIIKKNIKTVVTLHDCWFFTGKCFHYISDGCTKWQTECGNCPRLKKDIPSWFFDQTTKVFNDKKKYFGQISNLVVVGVSKWISNEAKQSFLGNSQITTIHNGVDIDIFKPTQSNFRKDYNIGNKYVILGMANKWLLPNNLETFQYITKKIGKNDVLVLVGCSEKQKKSLPDNVIGLGFVNDREKLAQIYSMADVFVNITWEDSLPTVNIEAICCGTPVITFDSCGSPEIINDRTGIVTPQGNSTLLWQAICNIKDKGKRQFENECVKLGVQNYNKNEKYKDYIILYEKMCNDNKVK